MKSLYLSLVSTETGDCTHVYYLGILPSHVGQLSLAIPQAADMEETTSQLKSESCYQDCCHRDL